MKRFAVILTCLVGFVASSSGIAMAAVTDAHDVCIGLAQNEDYRSTQYVCIDTP